MVRDTNGVVQWRGSFLPIVRSVFSDSPTADRWRVVEPVEPAGTWLSVFDPAVIVPTQGWKLHVSASVVTAEAVLRRTLPLLRAAGASFKLAKSVVTLGRLNGGDGGASQVGKFITVYPCDDAQAVRLAVALDAATRGLTGPIIPSDRRLRPQSLVSYRYGDFGGGLTQVPTGEVLAAIIAPDGTPEPDWRPSFYRAPAWAADPFAAAGIVQRAKPRLMIAGRYLILTTLFQAPRGSVYLALEVAAGRQVVLKRARLGAGVEPDGADARDRLRHEAETLRRLAPNPQLPGVYDLIEDGDDLILALEYLPGETLEAHIATLKDGGRLLESAEVIRLGRSLAATLAEVHAKGFIHRDLKPANVLLAPDKPPRLIDFELAYPTDSALTPMVSSTIGSMSPQQLAGERPAVADDIYGLGALLYCAATGASASHAPRGVPLLNRPLAVLNPALGRSLADVIARCLAPAPANRFASMSALDAALHDAAEVDGSAALPHAAISAPGAALRQYSQIAYRLGEAIGAAAQPAPSGTGLAWTSTHPAGGGGIYARDVNTGSAGTILALAELVQVFGDPEQRRILAESARWLAVSPPFAGPPLAGLYVGEAGVGAALLRAGEALADDALIDLAAARGDAVAALPWRSPDLFAGTAGRLRFHLMLWHATGAEAPRTAALTAGERLLAEAMVDDATGEMRWQIPDGYGSLSGQAQLGYAHGAAGIADALLDLGAASSDPRFRAAAGGAARWLARLAVPALDDGAGVAWPRAEGEPPAVAMWCHGAAGIGRFMLHAAQANLLPQAADLAARAALTVARGVRWAGPTRCHGLSGAIEFLLEMASATGDAAYRTHAQTLATFLAAFALEQEGHLRWPSEDATIYTPDYMVGYAGVARCHLLLAAGAWWPEPLHVAAPHGPRCRAGACPADHCRRLPSLPPPTASNRATAG